MQPDSPQDGAAPATVARKLAAIRGLYDVPGPHRASGAEPCRPCRQPEAGREAPSCPLRRADPLVARADPGPDPARVARPGDVRARLLLRPTRRGDHQPRPRLARLRDRAAAGGGQGLQDAVVPVGEPAQRALRRYLRAWPSRALPATRGSRRSSLSKSGPPALQLRRHRRLGALGARGGDRRGRLAALLAPLASPPICSREAPTCARSRSCSAIPVVSTTQVYTRVEHARLAMPYARSHPRA